MCEDYRSAVELSVRSGGGGDGEVRGLHLREPFAECGYEPCVVRAGGVERIGHAASVVDGLHEFGLVNACVAVGCGAKGADNLSVD